jgi:ATP synthase protein I
MSKKPKPNYNSYLRFSSLAIQMGVIIFAGSFSGNYLDKHYDFDKPVLTIILSLLSIAISLYFVYKEISHDK